MYAGEINCTFLLFDDEDWYHLMWLYVNGQNNSCWFVEHLTIIHRAPLHDDVVYVWCVTSATRITVPVFSEIVDTHSHITDMLMTVFEHA